jgi:hypothetical protein
VGEIVEPLSPCETGKESVMSHSRLGWTALVTANAIILGVLSLDRASQAAAQPGRQPFGNAVEQRNEIIHQLQEIRSLLQEQNRLLRSQSDRGIDERNHS